MKLLRNIQCNLLLFTARNNHVHSSVSEHLLNYINETAAAHWPVRQWIQGRQTGIRTIDAIRGRSKICVQKQRAISICLKIVGTSYYCSSLLYNSTKYPIIKVKGEFQTRKDLSSSTQKHLRKCERNGNRRNQTYCIIALEKIHLCPFDTCSQIILPSAQCFLFRTS